MCTISFESRLANERNMAEHTLYIAHKTGLSLRILFFRNFKYKRSILVATPHIIDLFRFSRSHRRRRFELIFYLNFLFLFQKVAKKNVRNTKIEMEPSIESAVSANMAQIHGSRCEK